MQSRISIDVDSDNQPIIRVDYFPSGDVKDKLVKRFLDAFGGQSTFATFFFSNSASNQDNTSAIIRPLPVKEFQYHVDDINNFNERYLEEYKKATPTIEAKP